MSAGGEMSVPERAVMGATIASLDDESAHVAPTTPAVRLKRCERRTTSLGRGRIVEQLSTPDEQRLLRHPRILRPGSLDRGGAGVARRPRIGGVVAR